MTDQTSSPSTEVELDSTPADTASVDGTQSQTTDNQPESTDEPPKRKLEDIINEKYDELRTKKEEQAAKNASDNATGTRKVEVPAKQAPAKTDTTVAPAKDIDPITGRELEPVKVPETTPGMLREGWSKIPRDWQLYISKRELEARQTIQRYGDDAKFAKEVYGYAKDMEQFLKQGNIKLSDYTRDLFQMAYRMSAGNQHQKAQVIAELINTFRPDANTLKALLGGQRPNIAPVQKQVNVDEEVNKRIAAQKKQEFDKHIQDTTVAFYDDQKNEFARRLDPEIGKAIEDGFVSVQDASGNMRPYGDILKDAYEYALANTPDPNGILKGILERRKGVAQPVTQPETQTSPVQNPNAGKQPVRQAAPSPGGGRPVKQQQKRYGKRVEDAAMDAWDVAAGRK